MMLVAMVLLPTSTGCLWVFPGPPPPPAPTTPSQPYPQPYRTCAEVLAAWNAGLIRADSLINGAVWIVDAQGRTVICPVPARERS